MPLFDDYLMVDWSASSTPKTGADSIWWALRSRGSEDVRVSNPATRSQARADVVSILTASLAGGRRVLVGLDFPFGYPRGTAAAVAGRPRWDAIWQVLHDLVEDRPDNRNNRFEVASALNARFSGHGPFWGHPHGRDGLYPALGARRPAFLPSHPPTRRHAEDGASSAKTVWQLSGAGSVGSQALLGLPFLQSLIDAPDLAGRTAVWPLQTGLDPDLSMPIVLAEIYPSLFKVKRQAGIPLDRTQVETVAKRFARWDETGRLSKAFRVPLVTDPDIRRAIVNEEGYILGVGCAPEDCPDEQRRTSDSFAYIRDPQAITRRSFEIIAAEADLGALPADIAPVAARMIHACGMTDLLADLAWSPGAGAAGLAALEAGAPIVCDVRMVAAGLMAARLPAANVVAVAIDEPDTADLAARSGQTRSAAGMELALARHPDAIVAIGNAPTALFRLLELVAEGAAKPALVLGLPVGFVGAAESKEALAANDLGIPFVTLRGRRGGSAMAAAALNALILAGSRTARRGTTA